MASDKVKRISLRNDYLNDLKEFISASRFKVNETLQSLNWSEDRTTIKEHERELTTCSLNQEHRVSAKNLEKHEETCAWHQQGYNDDDVPFPPAGAPTIASVKIDKILQERIIADAAAKNPLFKIGANVQTRGVPQTSDRFLSDFTTDERRALYDYVISQTAGLLPELKEFSLPSQVEGKSEMSREQLMAAERDLKRRRAKYRTAKVKGKKYSEVMREVINNQMQSYEEWLKEESGIVSDSPSGVVPEKKQTTEQKNEAQEMTWIDCDRRVNPYLRWKYLLEKEKRRAEEKKNPEKHNSKKDERSQRKEKEEDSRSKRKSERYDEDYRGQDKRRRYEDHHERSTGRDRYRYENDRHRNDRKELSKTYEKDKYRRGSHSSHDKTRKEHSRSEKDKHKNYEDRYKRRDQVDGKEDVRKRSRKHSEDDKRSLEYDLSKVKTEVEDNTKVASGNGYDFDEVQLLYKQIMLKKEIDDASSSGEETNKVSRHKKKHRKEKKSKKRKHKSKKKKKTSNKNNSTDSSDSSTDDSDKK